MLRVTWTNLTADVGDEFIDAQRVTSDRLRSINWRASSEYVARQRVNKKRWSLRALRLRLHARSPIACKNAKCRVEFVPYHAATMYCTADCRVRALALAAYHRRKEPIPARACRCCSRSFTCRRRDAVFCSIACNAKATRLRGASA